MALLFQIQSTLIVFLFTLGLFFRKNRRYHVRVMGTAMAWDVAVIVQIELSRGAVKKAMGYAENTVLLNIHVALALLTVILYVMMIHTGRKLLKGQEPIRRCHRALGVTTYFLRLLVYGTSFFVVS